MRNHILGWHSIGRSWSHAPFQLLALTIAIGTAAPAAASTFTVSGEADLNFNLPPFQFVLGAYGGSKDSANVPKSDSVMHDVSSTYPGTSRVVANIFSDADRGSAHASTNSIYEFDYQQGTSAHYDEIVTQGMAKVTLDDVVITGPPTATNVTTNISMHLDGNLSSSSTFSVGSNSVFASAGVSATLMINNTTVGNGTFSSQSSQGNFATTSGSGWLANFNGNATLTSSNFVVPVNTPFTLTFTLGVNSTTGMNQDNSGLAEASADFGSTLSFVTNHPVFALPQGYTADSLSGGIVANQFVPTPEPATWALLVTGSLALFVFGHRKIRAAPLNKIRTGRI
jgi:hypothetical protein